MSDSWTRINWATIGSQTSSPDQDGPLAWHKHLVPYVPEANALQTLEVWIPAQSTDFKVPEAAFCPQSEGVWIVYIHGGAWRDPRVDASSFELTAMHILSKQDSSNKIAGIASVNYSLSPYPDHQEDPSPPKDPKQPFDPSRKAKHPDHINDVLHALAFLQDRAKFGSRYMLVGHSCGATLALQVAMDHQRWAKAPARKTMKVEKPQYLLGLNGLYDLPGLVHAPGTKHEHLIPIYQAFIELAFGGDETSWREASPNNIQDWSSEWPDGIEIILGQSKEDTLVPYKQTGDMLKILRATGPKGPRALETELVGDHNVIWQTGSELANVIESIIQVH